LYLLPNYTILTPHKEVLEGIPMTDVKTITIDDKEYVLEDLSEGARAQLVSLQITDQEIIRLQQQQKIAQTARNAYAQALSAELPKDS